MSTRTLTANDIYDLGGEPVSDAIAMIDDAIAETARHATAYDFTPMHVALLELSAELEHYVSVKRATATKPTKYRTTNRPLMFSTYPAGVKTAWVELPQNGMVAQAFPGIPVSRHVFGVFTTDRQLTADELASYQIVVVP